MPAWQLAGSRTAAVVVLLPPGSCLPNFSPAFTQLKFRSVFTPTDFRHQQ